MIALNGLSTGDSMEKILEEMREKSDHILRTDFRVRGYGTSDRQKENKPGKVQKNKPKIYHDQKRASQNRNADCRG